MVLRKIISGGQTGADETGLECARALGLETGGTAPRGYKTERGANLKLKDLYGLKESPFLGYAPRTKQNVQDADVTLWFGTIGSPGYWCTKNAAKRFEKPFHTNPEPLELEYLANTYEVWNVAGNRESKNRDVVRLTRLAFGHVATLREKVDGTSAEVSGQGEIPDLN